MPDKDKPIFPLGNSLKYCIRCCMPETQEGLKFDEMGICRACQSAEEKLHIDWPAREKRLRKILKEAKSKARNNYDCIVPISGGKDSTFQLHVIVKVYKMKPLAVTFNHNWYSETGWYNLLNCLEQFNCDHIMFTPNRNLINRIAKRSLAGIGDACWHCHAGVGAFPLQIAVKFNIPLIVWGESISESSGRATYFHPVRKFDTEYFTKVSAKLKPEEMVNEEIAPRDLCPFESPSIDECRKIGLKGIHLGDYIFWDDERQTEFVRDTYGWKETEIEGTYKKYKSAECIMPGMHDFTNYLKRGYSRASFHASVDVRSGLLTRAEAFQIASEYDPLRPEVLDYYLKITGLSEKEFYKIMEKHKMPQLKHVKLPVKRKAWKNAEKLLPYAQQVINKHKPIKTRNAVKTTKTRE